MRLIAIDVGGTNIRFAVTGDDDHNLDHIQSMTCRDFSNIDAAIDHYMASLPDEIRQSISAISIAAAAPIMGDVIDLTNNHWTFSKTDLLNRFDIDQLMFVNDFTAQALAQSDPEAIGSEIIKKGTSRDDAALLVIGPGTGLGVAAIKPTHLGHIAIDGEGGHTHFTPRNDIERALAQFLGQNASFVSIEEIVSGPGLENIDRFLAQQDGDQTPAKTAAEIGAEAIQSDGRSRQAVFIMLSALGTMMTNAVITMGCWRGVVIAGGVVPRFQSIIHDSPLIDRFVDSGIMSDTFSDLPIWLATNPHCGLYGAREALFNPFLKDQILTK